MSETTSLPYMSSSLLTVTKSNASGMMTVAFGVGGNALSLAISQASLVAWYNASDITAFASGSSMSVWPNSSQAVDVTLASATSTTAFSAASQPIYNATGLNGKPSVAFNNGQVLDTKTLTSIPHPYTYFVVSSCSAPSAVARNVFGNSPFAGQFAAGIQWGGFFGGAGNVLSLVSVSANSGTLVTVFGNGATSTFAVGSTASSFNAGAGQGVTTFAVGGRSDASSYWVGQIAELIFYARLLGASEASSVQAYLKTKYSI